MKIYTKRGDGGETDFLDGVRISKCAPEVALMAVFDELCANIGAARASVPDFQDGFGRAQKNLSILMMLIADTLADVDAPNTRLAGKSYAEFFSSETTHLEQQLDAMEGEGLFQGWAVYGGCRESAVIDVARAVCRRAEVELCRTCATAVRLKCALAYVNRLSDYLSGCARRADKIYI